MSADKWRLDGKLALVTGGTQGIGLATVREFLARGAHVVVVARTAEDLERQTGEYNGREQVAHSVCADVSTSEGRKRIAVAIRDLGGILHALVNNVGVNTPQPAVDVRLEDFGRIMATNAEAAFDLCCRAQPFLKAAHGGAVVNVASIAGVLAGRTGAPYAMSKAALIHMAKCLGVEWASDLIRVNSVAPWFTRTPRLERKLENAEFMRAVCNRTPLRRLAEAEEVAAAVVFLCLPAASYITGHCLLVDGGATHYEF